MRPPRRPIPAPNAETHRFWAAMERGVLELAKCQDCGRIPYPPKPRCPDCLSDSLVWVELSGRARLRGWTDNHIVDFEGYDRPVCIVECVLEEDPGAVIAMFGDVGSVCNVAPGTPLKISFAADANGWTYPRADVDREATR